jgi:hypothetical protein
MSGASAMGLKPAHGRYSAAVGEERMSAIAPLWEREQT